ncbi:GAF and ANTAR domain-containing protein [Streptomyces longispororuber]|uniref:GAF and ANTAR domain-containing protein n=1 Tax=Streptomyces longispororuber TaxID=68230 RepID=UPI00210B0960|nr:GAF and ANTAR domain-containing protein [Streptomyces longispororuber]MCQ4212578.1 GAF and ANTAR domain-containing protein [Streptomyces longispororuber]
MSVHRGGHASPADVVARVAAVLTAAPQQQLPQQVCDAFASTLDADGCALSLIPHTEQALVVHATGIAGPAELAQFTLADGPTVTASATSRTVLIDDLTHTTWPIGGCLSDQLPHIRAALALPVQLGGLCLGTITAYSTHPHHFTPDQADHALAAAQLAAAPLADSVTDLLGSHPTATQATECWVQVHQAVGYLAAQLHCTTTDALDLLRARAFTQNVSLHHLATHILPTHTTNRRPDTEPPPHDE